MKQSCHLEDQPVIFFKDFQGFLKHVPFGISGKIDVFVS